MARSNAVKASRHNSQAWPASKIDAELMHYKLTAVRRALQALQAYISQEASMIPVFFVPQQRPPNLHSCRCLWVSGKLVHAPAGPALRVQADHGQSHVQESSLSCGN